MAFFKKLQTDLKLALLLIIIGLIASLLALIAPIEGDEAASFLSDWSYPFFNLIFNYSDITNHKLFTALSRISMELFGDHEWAFRLPVFFASAFSIPFIYFLTQLLFRNRQIAFLAALLLLFSFPRFIYSMEGRGYIFSIFFAIILLITVIKILETKPNIFWKILWVFGGVCFIFAIPSNISFLCSLAIYFLLATKYKKPNEDNFLRAIWPLWGLFIILIIYFVIVYDDLQRGIISYTNYEKIFYKTNDLKISFSRLGQTFEFLSKPWSIFFYLFSVLGLAYMREKKHLLFLFSSLFIVPILFISFSNVMGPPRTFVFWIPPIMILASCGIYEIGQKIPYKGRSIFICLFLIALGIISINEQKKFLNNRLNSQATRIAESKKVLEYIRTETTPHDLVLFSFYDRVLRHYIEVPSGKKMFNILNDGKLDRILIIGKKDISPNQILSIQGYNGKLWWKFPWTESHFTVEKKIESLAVKSLKLKINDLNLNFSGSNNGNPIGLKSNALFTVKYSKDSKILTKNSLILKRKIDKNILAISNNAKNLDIKSQDNFLLYIYARKLEQKSRSMLSRTNRTVPFWLKGSNGIAKYFQIAPLYGIFNIKEGKLKQKIIHPHWNYLQPKNELIEYWKIEFRLTQIESGNYKIKNIFEIKEDEAYFNGMQAFLIHK